MQSSSGWDSTKEPNSGYNENVQRTDPLDELLQEAADKNQPLEDTQLGAAVDNLMVQWNQLLGHIPTAVGHSLIVTPSANSQPSIDHIKELAEFSVRQFKDACLEVNGEFSKVSLEWKMSHPEEAAQEEIADLEAAIQRQRFLMTKIKERLNARTDNSSRSGGGESNMWHEARKQEKVIRNKLVDCSKRHERRKNFYESIRRDPDEFMQIHGRRATIHMDAAVANAAESSNILRKWQGDPNVLIDRFDARSHLDQIVELPKAEAKAKQAFTEDPIELQCEFERYRILIFNEFMKVSEKTCLQQIAAKEFWPGGSNTGASIHKKELEKKKKSVESKAAIGFSYGDSDVVSGSSVSNNKFNNKFGNNGKNNSAAKGKSVEGESESEEDELAEEQEEIDQRVDVDSISAEQAAELSKIGAKYSIAGPGGVFLKLCRMDRKEQDEQAQIREIDKAKLALSVWSPGKSRSIESTTTLLSFLANSADGKGKKKGNGDAANDSSDSSDSSDGRQVIEKTEFITSFGGDDEDERKSKNSVNDKEDPSTVVQGPVLPSKEYRRLLELKHARANSVDDFDAIKDPFGGTRRNRSSSSSESRSPRYRRGNETKSSGSRRRSRSRSRKRNRDRRSYSRDRYSKYSHRRSRSRSHERKNQSRKHRRSSSTSSSSSSNSRKNYSSKKSAKIEPVREEQRRSWASAPTTTDIVENRTKRDSSRSSASSSSSRSMSSKSESPQSIHSSMSESEVERIEIENRKRRIRKTERESRRNRRRSTRSNSRNDSSRSEKAQIAAQKLRQQMQKALKKTAAQQKAEEEDKTREQMRERKQREEELLEEARSLRKREREKEREREKKKPHATKEKSSPRDDRRTRRRSSSSSNSK
uniref:Suppressor of white apricot N-terminal domain-containing protein n=1 Tax=Ditylenchus dipsaci TaxID=166011 RepID=A0A915DH80_9BILA